MNWTWKLATDGHGCTRIPPIAAASPLAARAGFIDDDLIGLQFVTDGIPAAPCRKSFTRAFRARRNVSTYVLT
jgi:hypothetical protein